MHDLNDLLTRRLVYHTPRMTEVTVRKGIVYKTALDVRLALDLYYPPEVRAESLPAVVFVHGDTSHKELGNRGEDLKLRPSGYWPESLTLKPPLQLSFHGQPIFYAGFHRPSLSLASLALYPDLIRRAPRSGQNLRILLM